MRDIPTDAQCNIADMHCIPRSQAHTINVKKYEEYLKYKRSPLGKLHHFLDGMESSHWARLQNGE